MNEWPTVKYLIVIFSMLNSGEFTIPTNMVYSVQHLFCPPQLSAQITHSLKSRKFANEKALRQTLLIFSSLRPDMASCHNTPNAFEEWSLPRKPIGAKVMLNVINLEVEIDELQPGNRGSNITFCRSQGVSRDAHSLSIVYSSQSSLLLCCVFYNYCKYNNLVHKTHGQLRSSFIRVLRDFFLPTHAALSP